MPGGDFPVDGVSDLRSELSKALPFLPAKTIARLIRQYGTETMAIFNGCQSIGDLGVEFGQGVYQREVDWAIANEWVTQGDDFLWRRSKLGLRLSAEEQNALSAYIAKTA